MTIGQAWRAVRDRFREAGLATPELDARLLGEMAFGLDGLGLITHERDPAPTDAIERLEALAARRCAGEPIARIAGEKEFYGLCFRLVPETLVPRPETEMLVDFALQELDPVAPLRILDLGTGTGCIAVAILANLPAASAVGIDLSPEAVAGARGNAARHGVGERFAARAGSWFVPLQPEERFELIVANPPYIESAAIESLAPEVKAYDPRLALEGGADGLAAYRSIVESAPHWLTPGGRIALEIGATQGNAVAGLLAAAGMTEVRVKKDLAGLDRMVVAHHI